MSSRWRVIILSGLIVAVGYLLVGGVTLVRQAQRAARRSNAYGRLSQMRLALYNYQDQHGTLPPHCLKDDLGKPIHSWRALILPILDVESSQQLDLSQPWNSNQNREIIDRIPITEWTWFARDHGSEQVHVYTHIFAFLGRDSTWNETMDTPEVTIADNPHAILLVSIPESNIEPLEPVDITEDELRKLVENGHEVLFIMAGGRHTYGTVTIEEGELAFHTWQEVLDQRSANR